MRRSTRSALGGTCLCAPIRQSASAWTRAPGALEALTWRLTRDSARCPPSMRAMPPHSRVDLARAALDVLDRNRRGDWTCPASGIYPHQWLWDSCFIAIGLAHIDSERAAAELRALFRGQWRNGMLPHMIFTAGDAASRRVWRSHRFADAPPGVDTSCITQPPVAAIAVRHVAGFLAPESRAAFVGELYPNLVRYHRWLYQGRDPHRRGLVTLIHPWESGLDTTPPWIEALHRLPAPWWLRVALRLRVLRLVRALRRDTHLIPAAERSTDDDGLRMLVLLQRLRRRRYDLRSIAPSKSVLVEDLAFNALLVVANRALADLARTTGTAIDDELAARFATTELALEELWHAPTSQYRARDATSGELIDAPSVATLLPLWTPIAPERAEALVHLLAEGSGFWPAFPVPSVPTDAAGFDPRRYWNGPTWVNINWIVVQALRHRGEDKLAEQLRTRTLTLAEQSGFAEYFSPLDGEALGAEPFSWTAALVLALLER